MYSQSEIDDAVVAGALAPEQAASLRAFVAEQNRTPHGSEEYFRLVRGYNDVFIAIACILALTALGWLGSLVPIGRRSVYATVEAPAVLQSLFVAAGAWGLAELFTLRHRTALPSFLLTLYFGFSAASVFTGIAASTTVLPQAIALITGGSFAIGAAATWGFWLRFRVPVAPAVSLGLGVMAISMILTFVVARSVNGPNILSGVLLAVGIGLLVYATKVDQEDRWRVTERSDVAFWLHGLAGVVLIIPLAYFLGLAGGAWTLVTSIVMIVLFLLFTLVALVLDRKVYVVSCLLPLGTAIYALLQAGRPTASRSIYADPDGSPYAGGGYGDPGATAQNMLNTIMWPLLIVAMLMVLLAIFWAPVRRAIIGILPPRLRETLPGTEATSLEQARAFE